MLKTSEDRVQVSISNMSHVLFSFHLNPLKNIERYTLSFKELQFISYTYLYLENSFFLIYNNLKSKNRGKRDFFILLSSNCCYVFINHRRRFIKVNSVAQLNYKSLKLSIFLQCTKYQAQIFKKRCDIKQ